MGVYITATAISTPIEFLCQNPEMWGESRYKAPLDYPDLNSVGVIGTWPHQNIPFSVTILWVSDSGFFSSYLIASMAATASSSSSAYKLSTPSLGLFWATFHNNP